MIWQQFFQSFIHYVVELAPALAVGFFLSGVVHELIPEAWINRHLGGKGLRGIFWASLIGAVVPVCCWGSLPIAVSFRRKGASLGPVLALLIATPATSINALMVTAKLLGGGFAVYVFFSVLIMGIVSGIVADMFDRRTPRTDAAGASSCCAANAAPDRQRSWRQRLTGVLQFAFVTLPRDIGKETLLGIVLAALVDSVLPVGYAVKQVLAGPAGYVFALGAGLMLYMCATMGVPLVDALIKQGLSRGAGYVLLVVGPITSYGTLLVLRKEFGIRVLLLYLALVCGLAVLFGAGYAVLA